ncbi:putative secreted protein with PEP-CTERM sorting signal [Pseudoduganella flava]|uniref:PEP-CTERM sorting domain-containing protein n=1 Tax=Pseudoduganella flava TaxID=871742 RepID=A0A562PXI4_9BURK|nr:PEP-CTERM sorting domain-containing protein [Pseudoduganella flava]QGZ39870.1 PEP-CTERM sorting domain-containing protein [Pseudoduganella flava]TWI48796.1 putative secreted protein with PEP-CTERM sorting signal [Pseudoduganella flava]
MSKQVLVTAAFLGAPLVVQAGVADVWVTYTGFYDAISGIYLPDRQLVAHAVVDDLDNNGRYSLSEVRDFSFAGYGMDFSMPCEWQYRSRACLTNFAYTPNGEFTFAGYTSTDPRDNISYYSYRFASGESFTGGRNYWDTWVPTDLRWTEHTQISISAVPEPAAYAMLGIGAFTLLAFRRSFRVLARKLRCV